MPTFKKNPNPIMKRSGFKMKSGNTPLRKESRDWTGSNQGKTDVRSIKKAKLTSDINSFFSGLGKSVSDATSKIGAQLKKGQKERGIFSEAGKAEKRSRKPGESKFKADIRRKQEARKAAKTMEVKQVSKLPKVGSDAPKETKIIKTDKGYSSTIPLSSDAEWKQDKAKSKWLYKKNTDGSYTTKKGDTGKEIIVKEGDSAYDSIAGVFKKKSPTKIYDKKGKRRKNYKY